MQKTSPKRYCADPSALALMQRDGIGWGHDLDCGALFLPSPAARPMRGLRLLNRLKRKD